MYASAHALITASGNLPGGEVWSCGLRTMGQTVGAAPNDVADACLAAWTSFIQGSDNSFSNGVSLKLVSVRNVTSSGVTETLEEAAPASPVTGLGSPALPNQCAVVLSLDTSRAGRTGKGRIYLPLLAIPMGADGHIAAGRAALIVPGARSLIQALNAASNLGITAGGNRIAVQSQKGPSVSPVTGIRMGDVVDTQRRRRDALSEAYATASITG